MLLVAAVFVVSGCSGGGAPPPDAQLNVEEVATWYTIYRAKHNNRQTPPNEEAFVAFIKKTMKENGVDMRADFLVSPRDGKKFVVNYGKPMSDSQERNIVVYEQEGYDGKKWMAPEVGYAREVDDAELQQLLAVK
ncbi:MAG: hypothetical protein WD894_15910 [Pirellulales bacterium]